ncbi:MAG TPA: class I SAM-dependent methyltransferase [Acidiferrobacterales bacterium]|nr:class I SAM-dependent methyltransferase [Acidiferrobacterales bacterium]
MITSEATVATREYVFDNTHDQAELARLRAIEAVFDPPTKARLELTSLSNGWRCLEVGPGAGSIMYWLAEKVGVQGQIVAVDMNPRFLQVKDSSNIDVLKADIREVDLGQDRFDLIHGRYVLLHIPDYKSVLEKCRRMLKPGGWLVFEEPNFSAARPVHGHESACRSVERVNSAIRQMYTRMGIDHAMGLSLPATLQDLGFDDFRADNDAPLVRGGSGIARMMRMSAEQLRDKYIATGMATPEDVDAYCQFAENRETWAIYYATIGVVARSSGKAAASRR